MDRVDGSEGMMGYGRRIGVEVQRDIVEDEFGGDAENVFVGA